MTDNPASVETKTGRVWKEVHRLVEANGNLAKLEKRIQDQLKTILFNEPKSEEIVEKDDTAASCDLSRELRMEIDTVNRRLFLINNTLDKIDL